MTSHGNVGLTERCNARNSVSAAVFKLPALNIARGFPPFPPARKRVSSTASTGPPWTSGSAKAGMNGSSGAKRTNRSRHTALSESLKTRRTMFVRASRARRPSSRACAIRSSAFPLAAFSRSALPSFSVIAPRSAVRFESASAVHEGLSRHPAASIAAAQSRFSFDDVRLEPFERGFQPFSLVDGSRWRSLANRVADSRMVVAC